MQPLPLNNEVTDITFPVSFCVIASDADFRGSFKRCLESLPENSEVCVLLNRKAEAESLSEPQTEYVNGRRLIVQVWQHTDFSFATARNYAHDLATNDWVMWMDCDEVLAVAQHEGIGDIPDMMPKGVGAVMAGQASMSHAKKIFESGLDTDIEYVNFMQCRLYKRSTGAKWEGRCHEQIAQSISEAGFSFRHSTITIIHNGYSVDKQSLQNKIVRNVKLLLAEVAERGLDGSDLSKYYASVLNRELSAYVKYNIQQTN